MIPRTATGTTTSSNSTWANKGTCTCYIHTHYVTTTAALELLEVLNRSVYSLLLTEISSSVVANYVLTLNKTLPEGIAIDNY